MFLPGKRLFSAKEENSWQYNDQTEKHALRGSHVHLEVNQARTDVEEASDILKAGMI
jgi:hypothetical protein